MGFTRFGYKDLPFVDLVILVIDAKQPLSLKSITDLKK